MAYFYYCTVPQQLREAKREGLACLTIGGHMWNELGRDQQQQWE